MSDNITVYHIILSHDITHTILLVC
jgi:hypothetical protein